MKRLNLNHLPTDELVRRFADAAIKRGEAVLDSEARDANRMFHYMRAVDSTLRGRGRHAREALLPLLNNKNRFVRYYTAVHAFALAPERARAIIEWNHKFWFDAIAGDAGMTLYFLDNGEYKPD